MRDAVIYLVPVLVGGLAPLAALPLLTRALSPAQYGAWALAGVYAVFVMGLANCGLTIGFERNFFECSDEQKPALLYSVLAFVAGASVLALALTAVFRAPLAGWLTGSQGDASLLVCAVAAQAVTNVKAFYLLYFRNTFAASAYARYSIDETVLGTVLSLAFVVWLGFGPFGLSLGQLVAAAAVGIAVAVRVGRDLPIAVNTSLLTDALRVSLPLTPRVFLGVLGSTFDKYIVSLLASVDAVGIYSVGQRIANVTFTLMTALENVFTPRVYQRMFSAGAAGGAEVGVYLTPFAFASIAVALPIALFSEELLALLAPPAYQQAAAVIAVLCLYYSILFFGKPPQLTYARKTGITSALTVLNLGLSVVCNIILVRRWGALGAAWGTLVAALLFTLVSFQVRQRWYRIEWESQRLAIYFGVLFAAVLVTMAALALGISWPIRFAIKWLFLALYLWQGIRTGLLTRERVQEMLSATMSRRVPAREVVP
jgi:O-antigen/teichoic acid export membrane protein